MVRRAGPAGRSRRHRYTGSPGSRTDRNRRQASLPKEYSSADYWPAQRYIQGVKKGARSTLFRIRTALLAVTLAELVDLPRGLQDMLFAGVKRMRIARDLEFDERVLVTVFPLDGVTRGHGGARQDREIRRDILEHDFSVLGVYILFHFSDAAALKGANFRLLTVKVQALFGCFATLTCDHLELTLKVLCNQNFIKH